jgi:large subunit ribosomal protein L3
MPGLLGKKIGMSNIFSADGNRIPVTVIEVGPCTVLQIRTAEKNGYAALQLGFGVKKRNVKKPAAGFYAKLNLEAAVTVKEFDFNGADYKVGDQIKVDIFTEGEKIKVRGLSKGKGFQGVMRRHGFGGVGGTTHGQSDRLRAPGSIGASSYPSRVFKGQRMAGRMGYDNITVHNLQVVKVVSEKNILLVKGAIPGSVNSIVELYKK